MDDLAGRPDLAVAVSVVIPVRNGAAVLPTQLLSLAAQEFDGVWEVVVADNGSTDGTAAVAEGFAGQVPRLRVVDASRVAGINHARNVGARAARGDFLLFVDADDVVRPGWLAAMAAAAATCDAVGGRLDRSHRPPTDGLQAWRGFLPYPPGANCGLRATVYAELGGFDESYRGGGDDAELFWRLQLSGHDVCFVGDAVVAYRERDRWRDVLRQHVGYGRQDAHLYRDFRTAGMPRDSVGRALRVWCHLVARAPGYARSREGRRAWARVAGRRAGRVVGSVRWCTFFP